MKAYDPQHLKCCKGLLEVQIIFSTGIDDDGFSMLQYGTLRRIVATVNVPVNQVARFPTIQQFQKCLKPLMRKVFTVTVTPNR